MKTKGTADNLDKYVGAQLRRRRKFLGHSQDKMAKYVGVTFQQVQKYEKGTNRISASRLYTLAQFLKVPLDYFYEGWGKYNNIHVMPKDLSQKDAELQRLIQNAPKDVGFMMRAILRKLEDK